jgi:hypothetical protein
MQKQFVAVALFLLSLSASACSGSAHLVRKDATGGHVALQGPYMLAMGDARVVMATHCKGRFEAVERGDSVDFRCVRAKPAAAPLQIAEASAPQSGIPSQNGM